MSLRRSYKILALADDLGIKASRDPVRAILNYCEKRTHRFLHDFPDCRTLTDLLEVAAAKLGTSFVEIRSDDDLEEVRMRYLRKGERGFAELHEELSDNTFGITFRRVNRKPWELQFVSVIDCRGAKHFRSYFTKWHELGHLLVLTHQMRLSFRRTHCGLEEKDPEEALIDIIAGAVGFLPQLVRPWTHGEPSFGKIEEVRKALCPEASRQASVLGFVAAWPTPCLLLKAELGLKRDEQRDLLQHSLQFHRGPTPVLRAVQVSPNDSARKSDLIVFQNMRVPERSVIHQVFSNSIPELRAIENLSWWESSGGIRLPNMEVLIQAQSTNETVHALITPHSDQTS